MKRTVRGLITCLLLAVGSAVAAPSADGLYATLQTTMGNVCFELYYTNVPRTVANFVSLAEGSRPWIDPRSNFISRKPYYNGIIFHRVINGFMIQGGSPKGDGTDGPGYTFEDEFDPALRHNRPGIVSMANSGPDSNGGQFFITVTAYPALNDKHSVFGSVVEGMNIVSNIAAVATTNDKPLDDVTITNVFITRNGTKAQNFAVTNQSLPKVEGLPLSISGLKLSAGTTTSSYQYVYSSTNLTDWSEAISDYWPAPNGGWNLTASGGETKEFFHANRVVYYTPDTNMTMDVTGHRIVVYIGEDVFDVTINASNSGMFLHAGEGHPVTYWDWKQYPYHAQFRFQAGYLPLRFDLDYTTPTSGRCKMFYLSALGYWESFGDGTFTDQNLN